MTHQVLVIMTHQVLVIMTHQVLVIMTQQVLVIMTHQVLVKGLNARFSNILITLTLKTYFALSNTNSGQRTAMRINSLASHRK